MGRGARPHIRRLIVWGPGIATGVAFATILVLNTPVFDFLGPPNARYRNVAVSELDDFLLPYTSLSSGKLTEAELHAKLGNPLADVATRNGERRLIYAIRAWAPLGDQRIEGIAPAAILRITFDDAGIVSDWYFIHSVTGAQLPQKETLEDATRSMSGVCGWPVENQVVLETGIQRGVSKMSEVIRLLPEDSIWISPVVVGQPMASLTLYPRRTPTPDGEAWEYYVDRPAPIFIPPFHFDMYVNDAGAVRRGWVFHAYGGCI